MFGCFIAKDSVHWKSNIFSTPGIEMEHQDDEYRKGTMKGSSGMCP